MNISNKIAKFFGRDEETIKKLRKAAAVNKANTMYTIIKVGDKGMVLCDGKPASTDWDTDAEYRLYRLRELYIERCMEKGEIL